MKDRNLINKLQKIWDENQEKRKPPTADEVCFELNKLNTNEIWSFSGEKKYSAFTREYISNNTNYTDETIFCEDGKLSIEIELPPHLIELIARFYKGLE